MGGPDMNDDNLDLLDLDDNSSMDALPDAAPFAAPRPKKPWLLLSIGLVAIVLSTYIIVKFAGDSSSSSIEVDLDAPAVVVEGAGVPVDMNVMPPVQPVQVAPNPQPAPAAKPAPKPQPVAQPQPVQPTAGVPVRVVEERKEVTFNPAAAPKVAAPQPVAKKQEAAAKPAVKKAAPKPAAKPVVAKPAAGWYVQFGSYSSRALAENAQRQIRAAHQSLFAGQQFVILAAQLKNGTTTYRLRVAFQNASDANGFCRNAKSDGLDCYVAK